MKKILILLIFMMCFNPVKVISQMIPLYPIPSYNVTVEGYASFRPSFIHENNTKEKRDLHVKIGHSAGLPGTCNATVWIYSTDLLTVLGAYYLECGETLTVSVEGTEWNVLVESSEPVTVDVWYSDL